MSSIKEPTYFARQDRAFKRLESYLTLFSHASNEVYVGESSTGYTKIPLYSGVPERIHTFDPDVRLIYIMRDPVERVLSHFRHELREGRNPGNLTDAVRNDPQYVSYSNYAMQLEGYMRIFDGRQLHTLTMEEYAEDSTAALSALLQWLGLDDRWSVQQSHRRQNVSQPFVLDEAKAGHLYNVFKLPVVRRVGQMRALAPLRKRIVARFGRSTEIDEEEVAKTIRYLRPIQEPQVERLRGLLQRDFPQWTTLYGQ